MHNIIVEWKKGDKMNKGKNFSGNIIAKRLKEIMNKPDLDKLEEVRLYYLGGDMEDLFKDITKLEMEIFQILNASDVITIEKIGGYKGLLHKLGQQSKNCPQRDFLRREVVRMKYLREVFVLKIWALTARADKYKAQLLEVFFNEEVSFQEFSLKAFMILYYQNLKKIELEQKVGRASKIMELYERQIGRVPAYTMPKVTKFLEKQESHYKEGIENLEYSNLFQKYGIDTYLEYKDRIQRDQFSHEELLKGLFSGNIEQIFEKIFPSLEEEEKEKQFEKKKKII